MARTRVIKAKKVGRDWVILDLDYTRKRKPKGDKNHPRRTESQRLLEERK